MLQTNVSLELDQTVGHRPVTSGARVLSQAISHDIYDRRSGIETRCSPLSFRHYSIPISILKSLIFGWQEGEVGDLRKKKAVFLPDI